MRLFGTSRPPKKDYLSLLSWCANISPRSAGVPQALLPAWADCYDFANRVELLRVGCWANKKAKPRWSHAELSAALREVIICPKAEEMRRNARSLAEKFPESMGRERAAAEILSEMNKV
jgi:UDP:flavonoid glycosyltransferase YjiC (YdhE family)